MTTLSPGRSPNTSGAKSTGRENELPIKWTSDIQLGPWDRLTQDVHLKLWGQAGSSLGYQHRALTDLFLVSFRSLFNPCSRNFGPCINKESTVPVSDGNGVLKSPQSEHSLTINRCAHPDIKHSVLHLYPRLSYIATLDGRKCCFWTW